MGEKLAVGICYGCFDPFLKRDHRVKYCSGTCREMVAQERAEAWYLDNRERHAEVCKSWRKSNADRWRDINNSNVARWRDGNPEKVKSQRYRRRTVEKAAFVEHVSLDVLIRRDKGVCQLCGESVNLQAQPGSRRAPSVDHIVPLTKGGRHSYRNCQLAHMSCNSSKGNRIE